MSDVVCDPCLVMSLTNACLTWCAIHVWSRIATAECGHILATATLPKHYLFGSKAGVILLYKMKPLCYRFAHFLPVGMFGVS